jgi:Uma2 family endonuclease
LKWLLSYDHSSDNTVITLTVSLFGIAKNIPLTGLINCSYRQQGKRECQPDLSYYLGERAQVIPYGTKIVSLNQYPPPDLAIEVGDSSLEDDLNRKKQLYQELQVSEYWVVDVEKAKLLAFSVSQEDTPEITQSRILPELETSLLEEALRRSRTSNQTEVGTWLMQQFQGK